MDAEEAIDELRSLGSEANRLGMARFGIATGKAFGVPVREIRRIAKQCGKSHTLALDLWASGFHEARILASVVDVPADVTSQQMDAWIEEFDSWDLCDQCCLNLFDKTPFAWKKISEWSRREPEFEKRAAFALIATLAGHDKLSPDARFSRLLPLIEKHSADERNYVWKAVNWALRGIGKRNAALLGQAIDCAERILARNTRAGRWIARDALRELKARSVN